MAEITATTVTMFLMPGEAILSLIGGISPETEAIMRIDYGATIYPLIFSLLVWTLALIIGLYIVKFVKNALWQTSALFRTFVYWIKSSLGNIKTRLLWQYRRFFPHRSDDTQLVSQEEFDKFDIAVLRTLFRKGPGAAASAPELARAFDLRPVQVQRRLEKLAQNHMLCAVTGPIEVYENYRLTDSGLTFITMMQRQARVSANVSPVSVSGPG
jgi:hypothetical protein